MIGITGASGFIGHALLSYLERQGRRYRTLSRNGYEDWQAYAGLSTVIHLAAIAHRQGPDDQVLRRVNLDLAVKAAQAAAKAGVRRFLFVSSSKVLGDFSIDTKPLDEQTPPAPPDSYGQAKCKAEQELLNLHRRGLIEVTVIRPALVVGAPAKANLLSLAKSATGPAAPFWGWFLDAFKAPRSVTSLGNLCTALDVACDHPAAAGRIFHVVDEDPCSVSQLHRLMRAGARGSEETTGALRAGFRDRPALSGAARRAFASLGLALIGRPSTYFVMARPLVLDGRSIQHYLGWKPERLLQGELIQICEQLLCEEDRR